MDKKTQITDLNHSLGKIETQIKNLYEGHKDYKLALESLNRRLSIVEKHNSFIKGSVAALLTVGALLGAFIDQAVKWVIGR